MHNNDNDIKYLKNIFLHTVGDMYQWIDVL